MIPMKPVYTLTNIPELTGWFMLIVLRRTAVGDNLILFLRLTGRSFKVIYDPSRTVAIVL